MGPDGRALSLAPRGRRTHTCNGADTLWTGTCGEDGVGTHGSGRGLTPECHPRDLGLASACRAEHGTAKSDLGGLSALTGLPGLGLAQTRRRTCRRRALVLPKPRQGLEAGGRGRADGGPASPTGVHATRPPVARGRPGRSGPTSLPSAGSLSAGSAPGEEGRRRRPGVRCGHRGQCSPGPRGGRSPGRRPSRPPAQRTALCLPAPSQPASPTTKPFHREEEKGPYNPCGAISRAAAGRGRVDGLRRRRCRLPRAMSRDWDSGRKTRKGEKPVWQALRPKAGSEAAAPGKGGRTGQRSERETAGSSETHGGGPAARAMSSGEGSGCTRTKRTGPRGWSSVGAVGGTEPALPLKLSRGRRPGPRRSCARGTVQHGEHTQLRGEPRRHAPRDRPLKPARRSVPSSHGLTLEPAGVPGARGGGFGSKQGRQGHTPLGTFTSTSSLW